MALDYYTRMFTYDHQRANLWELTIINPVGGGAEIAYGNSQLDSSPTASSSFLISTMIKSCNLPFWQFTTETSTIGNKFISKVEKDLELTFDFYETNNFDVHKYLDNWWSNSIFDKKTMSFYSDIKGKGGIRRGILSFQSPTSGRSLQTSRVFTLDNLIFKGFGEYSLDYENGDGLITSATFTCDEIIEQ